MKRIMLFLIILAGFIPAILAIVQYLENERKEKEARDNELELRAKIDSLSSANSRLSTQLSELSNENVKLSHQLTETSLLLNSSVLGGSKVDIVAFKAGPTHLKVSAKNNSSIPVYDIQVVILDYEMLIKCNKTVTSNAVYIDKKCYKQHMSIVPTFNMSPKNETELPNLLPVRGDYIHYAFQIKTRVGITLRHSIFKIFDNKVEQSYRIYDFKDERLTLTKEINPLNITKEHWNISFYSQPYVYMQGYD